MASSSRELASSTTPWSSSPALRWTHDVFLSFRGKDTRNNFTAHLYSALVQRGIKAYMDETELARGNVIEPTLLKAIEESRFSIVVFSKDYASSPWCLDELVKIIECMKEMGQCVLPVFYGVDPSEVGEQTGNYGEAFVKHGNDLQGNHENVQKWRDSLSQAANLSGWDARNRNEAEIIKEIIEKIWYKLHCAFPSVSKGLVGMGSRLEKICDLLGEGLNDVRIIGICGMGGIGKTTIARVVYDRIHWQFEGSCFLANVREVFEKHGPLYLQEQLLSEILLEQNVHMWDAYRGRTEIKKRLQYKKVLVVLDDVNKLEQLEMLAGEHGWFGSGSRIIMTSRDKHLLSTYGCKRIYEAKELNDLEARTLFNWKAFKQDMPWKGYWEMSRRIVGYCKGLPLALEVLGSFLHGRSKTVWESAISRLNEHSNKKITGVLQLSFDGLEEFEKKIFLDIACFFKGMDKDQVTRILDSCGFHADIGIQVLIDKSLISVLQNTLRMHDLLQIMGREIVRRESPEEPGRRSRLWSYEDVSRVLMNGKGRKVESILLDLPARKKPQWNMEMFSKMNKLRLLKVRNVELAKGPAYLSNELRFLEWHSYPSKSLPSFQMDKLVELNLSCSDIKQFPRGYKTLFNLKVIDFSGCRKLTKTPDFSDVPNLEQLNLRGCTKLSKVHPSIGLHKKLINIDLGECKRLRGLPSYLEMESLQDLVLDGCSKLRKFPDIVGNMECLIELNLDGTSIKELPLSIQHLSGLVTLSLENCKSLEVLPCCISCLNCLHKLSLYGCSKLENLPEDLGLLEYLEELNLSQTSIKQLPISIFHLRNLKEFSFDEWKGTNANPIGPLLPSLSCLYALTLLSLRNCNIGEGEIPSNIDCLSSLWCLDLCMNNFVSLPTSIVQLSKLEILILGDCKLLQSLPDVPSAVKSIRVNGCISLEEIPDPIKLCSLEKSEFACLNCWKLYENNGHDNIAFNMFKRYLQGLANPRPRFSIVSPGSKISKWFNHQREGSRINIQMPSNLNAIDEWMGIAACVAFSVDKLPYPWEMYLAPGLLCAFKINDRQWFPHPLLLNWELPMVLSDHLWLFFLSFDYFKEWQHEYFSNMALSLHADLLAIKVKKCSVRLVSYHDVEEFNQVRDQYNSSMFEDARDFHQEYEGSSGSGALVERIHDLNDAEEPSETASSYEEPPPRRLKQLRFF